MNNKRTFIYQPYAENGDAVLLYFHKKPSEKDNYNSWDMTGVDVPTKECPNEWSFWRNIQNDEVGNDDIPHDLSESEIEEIKEYIIKHREQLVPNMFFGITV